MIPSLPLTSRSKKARVEIIPLIDVIFFLLATFVLFTLNLDRLGVFKVTLPDSGSPPEVDTTLYIKAVAKNMFSYREGRFGEERTVGPGDLKQVLTGLKERGFSPRVMVSGGKDVSFGATIDIFDVLYSLKIKEAAIDTSHPTD